MIGYNHPCRYCDKLVPPTSQVCPFCGKVNPLGPLRCPKCRTPIQKDYAVCRHCGLSLTIRCPTCGKPTFFGDYCEHCDTQLVVVCPRCGAEQPPIENKCFKCGTALL